MDEPASDDRADPARFRPGTLGCHEALHMARVLAAMVEAHLHDHPAVRANLRWRAMAERAVRALGDLHRAIGADHLGAPAGASQPALRGEGWMTGLPTRLSRVLERIRDEGRMTSLAAEEVRAMGRDFWARETDIGPAFLRRMDAALGGWDEDGAEGRRTGK